MKTLLFSALASAAVFASPAHHQKKKGPAR